MTLRPRLVPVLIVALGAAGLVACDDDDEAGRARPPDDTAATAPGPVDDGRDEAVVTETETDRAAAADDSAQEAADAFEAVELASGALRETVTRLRDGEGAPQGVNVREDDGRFHVEVVHSLDDAQARAAVEDAGGRVTGTVEGTLVEAIVPFDRLEELEATDGIDFVRPPLRINAPAVARASSGSHGVEAVDKTRAAQWLAAGYSGGGMRVGIVDLFDEPTWAGAVAAGELANPAGTFCSSYGRTCNLWRTGIKHGVGVGEIVHDMAPGAALYLASVDTASDLQAAVNWFAQNGVRIITRSLTAEYDGPGDGTGALAQVVDDAVARGIVWFNSAGNNAGNASQPGSYWRGAWRDADNDRWLEFADGDELMAFNCSRMVNGLRWSDWGGGRTNYNAFVFDETGQVLLAQGTNIQSDRVPPIEWFNPAAACKQRDLDVGYLAIGLADPGGGTDGDVLEFMTNSGFVEYPSNRYSSTGPVADTANAGAIAVGAVDPAQGTSIAVYSSQGPTNDDRVKPDLSAAACISSFAYSDSCFNGTSAATPVAAGAAALVLEAWPATTPQELKRWLSTEAVTDRGDRGDDNVYGAGELSLPGPPAQRPATNATIGDVGG
jgi:hypothetical protein